MRVLDFIITGQTIKRDPLCDFSGIVAGSRGYLFAHFTFSREWGGHKKVAVFTCKGREFPVPVIYGRCEIPAEVLTGGTVQLSVLGAHGTSRVPTDRTDFYVQR